MFGGDFASDMAANGARNDARAAYGSLAQANRNIVEMNEANAGNLGVRCALEEQLRMVDPKNPLLVDESLVHRIKAAAVTGMIAAGNHFDGAREVGRTFRIPDRENGPPPPVATLAPPKPGNDVAKLKTDYAGLVALRDALVRQLRINDPTNPLLGDPMLQMKVRAAGQTAFIMNGEDLESARNAGKTFSIPGRD